MIDFSLPEISELLYRMSNDWNKVYSSAPIPNKLFYNIKLNKLYGINNNPQKRI